VRFDSESLRIAQLFIYPSVMEIICKNEQDNLVDLKSENDIVVTLKKIEK